MSRCGRVIEITGLVSPNDGQKKDSDGDYNDKVVVNFLIKPKTHMFVFTSEAASTKTHKLEQNQPWTRWHHILFCEFHTQQFATFHSLRNLRRRLTGVMTLGCEPLVTQGNNGVITSQRKGVFRRYLSSLSRQENSVWIPEGLWYR